MMSWRNLFWKQRGQENVEAVAEVAEEGEKATDSVSVGRPFREDVACGLNREVIGSVGFTDDRGKKEREGERVSAANAIFLLKPKSALQGKSTTAYSQSLEQG
jgi:hypothetical protein